MGTGTAVNAREIITAEKMNKKLETIGEDGYYVLPPAVYTFENTYKNETGRTIYLSLSCSFEVYGESDDARVDLRVGNVSPPTKKISNQELYSDGMALTFVACVYGIVPPNYYWKTHKAIHGNGVVGQEVWYAIKL